FSVAQAFRSVYENLLCPLVYPRKLLTDGGVEFKKHVKSLMEEQDVDLQSHDGVHRGMAEAAIKLVSKKLYLAQDAADLLLPIEKRARMWKKELPFVAAEKNKTSTRM